MGPEVTNKKTAQFKGMLEWYSTHYAYQKPTIQQLHGYCCVITKSLYAFTGGWIESRIMEAEKLGFNEIIIPFYNKVETKHKIKISPYRKITSPGINFFLILLDIFSNS